MGIDRNFKAAIKWIKLSKVSQITLLNSILVNSTNIAESNINSKYSKNKRLSIEQNDWV